MKPITVLVHWSESPEFRDGESLPFRDFERRAAKAAADKGRGGGYDKTKITVTFDNGDTYECRLDLAEDDDTGFEQHIRETLRFYETERGAAMVGEYLVDAQLVEAAKAMDFAPDKPTPAGKRHPIYAAALSSWTKNPTRASVYIGATDTAKLIRAALKSKFSSVKFSVRTSKYAGGASIQIDWTDGPTAAMVEAVIAPFEGAGFDGMEDYKYSKGAWLLPDGTAALRSVEGHFGADRQELEAETDGALPVHFGADFLFTRRQITPEAMRRALQSYATRYPGDDLAEAIKRGEVSVKPSDYDGAAELTGDPHRFAGIGTGYDGATVLRNWAARRMMAA